MAIVEIQVQFRENETHSSQTLTLDGVRVRFDAYTNKADGCWYFNLYDSQDTPILLGVGMVTGLDLLFPYRYKDDVPPGVLFVNDLIGERTDPALDAFITGNAALYYQEANS